MKLVVEIPEEQYITLNAKSQEEVVAVLDSKLLVNAIKNGTPLPKGHGRLGDLSELETRISNFISQHSGMLNPDIVVFEKAILEGIKATNTIIEADKEQEDGKV